MRISIEIQISKVSIPNAKYIVTAFQILNYSYKPQFV